MLKQSLEHFGKFKEQGLCFFPRNGFRIDSRSAGYRLYQFRDLWLMVKVAHRPERVAALGDFGDGHHTDRVMALIFFDVLPERFDFRIFAFKNIGGKIFRGNIDEEGDINASGLHISAHASLGLNVSFGSTITLKLGPEFHYGITDVVKEETYIDIFGRTKKYQPTTHWKYGGKMSLILRL